MAFELDDIVPFGRSYDEYRAMFALGDNDAESAILDCGGGPAAFNAGATRRGGRVVSADPLYRHPGAAIARRIAEVLPEMERQLAANATRFCWDRHPDPASLVAARDRAMQIFLADFPDGRLAGRYLPARLPHLPFADHRFGVALVSHLLFLYSRHLDRSFHLRAVAELSRVAREVRIFPVADLDGRRSPHLDPLRRHLDGRGLASEVVTVDYESQVGVREMLRIASP